MKAWVVGVSIGVLVSCHTTTVAGVAATHPARYGTAIPVQSLPVVDSARYTPISVGTGAAYRGSRITQGIQLGDQGANVEFKLAGHYTQVSGMVYADDSMGDQSTLTISDNDNPAHPVSLASITLQPKEHASFRVSVRGVQFLTMSLDGRLADVANDIVGTATTGPLAPTRVTPQYPTGGAGVPANSRVQVAWQPFPGAANYLFRVWLVSPHRPVTLTSRTPVTVSTLVYHATTYTWNNAGYPAGSYQYQILPLNERGTALGVWSEPITITVFG